MDSSWLYEMYNREERQEEAIESLVHENSVKLSREVKYHSMHTPIKRRDPQRLAKAMDSVEIMRKRKSTQSKRRRHQDEDNTEGEEEKEHEEEVLNSLPVGRKF